MWQNLSSVPANLPPMEPEKLKALIEFMNNEAANPPKVADLFKIPDGLSPAWQQFFDKVASYHERQCKDNRHALISLEKRSWIMEDEKLSEMEMLLTATDLKEKGNAEFKEGDITRAQIFYSSSISTFPTPDAMNNLAACALRQNRFDVAESFATKALDIDLFSKPQSIAKAHYRRALARLHLAKFKEAHEDVILAKQFNPSDASISELSERIESVSATVKSQDDIANYLKEQPQANVKMSFTEAFNKIEELDITYIRIPEPALSSMKTLLPLFSY